MSTCPKCNAFYADDATAFCLVDGTPLVKVDPGSDNWREGARLIEEKKKDLKKQQRRSKWRWLVMSAMTALILTMVVANSVTVETTSPSVYKISVHVSDARGPLAGVTLRLDGAKTASATTNADGNYTFDNLPAGGIYTITPARTNTEFTPTSQPVDNLRKDESANFIGREQLPLYKINVHVKDARGPLAGVTLRLDGPKTASATTNADGNYTFDNLPAGGNYTITPREHLRFHPPRHFFNNLRRDDSGEFFQTAATPTPTPTPTPECSRRAMYLEANRIVRDSKPGWKRIIDGERGMIRDKYAVGLKNAEISVGTIAYRIRFLKPCEKFVVTATYTWRIYSPGNANSLGQTESWPGTRMFTCERRRGAWRCP